jgi:hypothetical protein
MKTKHSLLGVFVAGLVCSAVLAGDEVKSVRLTCELEDGSRVLGVVEESQLGVRTDFAALELPLVSIRRILFLPGKEKIAVEFRNGDKVTGALRDVSWNLSTVFGVVSLPLDKVREIRVHGAVGAAADGLVLWNGLGSRDEIGASRVGAAGIYKGGSFGDGKFGGAFVAAHNEPLMVTFPADAMTADAGCIEFWARLNDFPRELAWGQNPTLMRLRASDNQFILHLNGNDGNSRGGLCAQAGPIGGCGTGRYGAWTYEQVLGAGKVGQWHHYALVWDKKGIDGVANGNRRVAIFLDGVLHASEEGNASAAMPSMDGAVLELFYNQHVGQGSVSFDNLKLWNYAKTEFSDRESE